MIPNTSSPAWKRVTSLPTWLTTPLPSPPRGLGLGPGVNVQHIEHITEIQAGGMHAHLDLVGLKGTALGGQATTLVESQVAGGRLLL
jgi:hypothetical protein